VSRELASGEHPDITAGMPGRYVWMFVNRQLVTHYCASNVFRKSFTLRKQIAGSTMLSRLLS
jgi:hypothetical protein